jgi:hypothetical protein
MGVRVVVADDSYLIREGLRVLLDTIPEVELVAAVGTLPDSDRCGRPRSGSVAGGPAFEEELHVGADAQREHDGAEPHRPA